MANNFQNSLDLFKKANRKIPLASQTFQSHKLVIILKMGLFS